MYEKKTIYDLLNDIDSEEKADLINDEIIELKDDKKEKIKQYLLSSTEYDQKTKSNAQNKNKKKYALIITMLITVAYTFTMKQNIYATIKSVFNAIQTNYSTMFNLGDEAEKYVNNLVGQEKKLPGNISIKLDKILIDNKKIYLSLLASIPYESKKVKYIEPPFVDVSFNDKYPNSAGGSMGVYFVENKNDNQIFAINCEYSLDEKIIQEIHNKTDLKIEMREINIIDVSKSDILSKIKKAINSRDINMIRSLEYFDTFYNKDYQKEKTVFLVKDIDMTKLNLDTKNIDKEITFGCGKEEIKVNKIKINRLGIQADVKFKSIENLDHKHILIIENEAGNRIKMIAGSSIGDDSGITSNFSSVGQQSGDTMEKFMNSKSISISAYTQKKSDTNVKYTKDIGLANSIKYLRSLMKNIEINNVYTTLTLNEPLDGTENHYSLDMSNYILLGKSSIYIDR